MSTYWLSDVCSLFSSFNLSPFSGDKNERYNALTRLIIILTLIAFLVTQDENALIAGMISLILSVIIYIFTYNKNTTLYKKQDKTPDSAFDGHLQVEGARTHTGTPLDETRKTGISSNQHNHKKIEAISDAIIGKYNSSADITKLNHSSVKPKKVIDQGTRTLLDSIKKTKDNLYFEPY